MTIATPFYLNAPAKLATNWFGEKERALATAIGVLANPAGNILGLAFGPIFVDVKKCPTTAADFYSCVSENEPYLKASIEHYLIIQAIISTVLNIGTIVFMREKPDTPPSIAAASKKDGKLDMKKDFMLLIKNRNFFVICGAFICSFSL